MVSLGVIHRQKDQNTGIVEIQRADSCAKTPIQANRRRTPATKHVARQSEPRLDDLPLPAYANAVAGL